MNEYEEEFKAVKTIMDAVFKFWPRLSPDTRVWVKSRLLALSAEKTTGIDEGERD